MFLDKVIIVGFENLEQGLKDISTPERRFWIQSICNTSVLIGFEQNSPCQIDTVYATYPCYMSGKIRFNHKRIIIVLDLIESTENATTNGSEYLFDCVVEHFASAHKEIFE